MHVSPPEFNFGCDSCVCVFVCLCVSVKINNQDSAAAAAAAAASYGRVITSQRTADWMENPK